jgi:SAM-dependent methyltransferase
MMGSLKQAVRARLPRHFAQALTVLRSELKANRIARRGGAALRNLEGAGNLKVQIGAGDDIRAGWVNIDLALRVPPGFRAEADPHTKLINYDLRRGLPLPAGSCDYIYSSHFLEHLELEDGIRLMEDCHRALRPGGVFRAALPAFPAMFRAYVDRDESFFSLVDIAAIYPDADPETLTLADHVNYGVYQHGEHKCIYDEDKIIRLLRKIGFASAASSEYQEGIDPPSPLRRRYSFYVEAVK